MASAPAGQYVFGEFQLDISEQRLQRGDELIPLTAKAFELLCVLVAANGHLVDKQELLRRIWGETFVEEAVLSVNVAAIRRALGDNGRRYIETVAKRGYRFTTPVREISANVSREPEIPSQLNPDLPEEQRLTQARRDRHAWLGIAAGTLVLAIGAVLWLYHPNKAQSLTPSDTVVLADFANATGDPAFDNALRQALSVGLAQSPFFNILPEREVSDTLKLMRRSPDDAVDERTAVEICERTQSKAVFAGSIAALGSQYVLGLKVLNCRTGDVLAEEQAPVSRKEDVLETLNAILTKVRGRVGESLSMIAKFDAPLANATTSDLEALKALARGRALYQRGKVLESATFFKQACDRDPDFALAYANLAVVYLSAGERERAIPYLKKAFELRERTSEREKLYIAAVYYRAVTGELDKRTETLELLTATYPRSMAYDNNLGRAYEEAGKLEQAAKQYRAAIHDSEKASVPYSNLVRVLINLNRIEEAKAAARQAIANGLDNMELHVLLYVMALAEGDRTEQQRQEAWAAERSDEYQLANQQAMYALFTGKIAVSRDYLRRANEMAAQQNLKGEIVSATVAIAWGAALAGDCSGVRKLVPLAHGAEVNVATVAAGALAVCGSDVLAAKILSEAHARYPTDTEANRISIPTVRAILEMERGNGDKAIDLTQAAERYAANSPFTTYVRGLAFLKARKGTEAAAEFIKIAGPQGVWPIAPEHALAYVGLARAYAMNGNTNKARDAYENFFHLWNTADPDIPILTQAKLEYAKLK